MYERRSVLLKKLTEATKLRKYAKKPEKNKEILEAAKKYREVAALGVSDELYDCAYDLVKCINPELADALDESDAKVENASTLMKNLDETCEHIEEVVMKIYRALKSMCLITDTASRACDVLRDYEPVMCAVLVSYSMQYVDDDCLIIPLSAADWKTAITLAAFTTDPTNIIVDIDPSIKEPCPEMLEFYSRCVAFLLLQSTARKNASRLKKAERDLGKKVENKAQVAELSRLNKRCAELQDSLNREQEKSRSAVDNAILPLQRQLQDKDNTIEQLNAELIFLREKARQEEEEEAISSDELLALPESGVTFVGGHCSVQQKISAQFPKWRVIPAGSERAASDNSNIVFLYSDSVSHKLYWSARKNCSGDILFCHGVNIDRLLLSMQQAYTMHMRGK